MLESGATLNTPPLDFMIQVGALMNSRHLARTILERSADLKGIDAIKFHNGQEWESISYPELAEIIKKIGANLIDMGIIPGDRVGIFSENRPEWSIVDLAILSIGAVSEGAV
jgi:long-chain acyl-CoA synthetase